MDTEGKKVGLLIGLGLIAVGLFGLRNANGYGAGGHVPVHAGHGRRRYRDRRQHASALHQARRPDHRRLCSTC